MPLLRLSAFSLYSLVATYLLLVTNDTFWSRASANIAMPALAVFGVAIWALTLLTLAIFAPLRAQRPMLAMFLILAAVTSYYQDKLGATIDREMIQNVMNTTMNESKHLITLGFVLHVTAFGILPAALLLWVRVKPLPLMRSLGLWVGTVVFALALFFGALYAQFKTFSAVLREHKEIIASYQPGAPISATFNYTKQQLRTKNIIAAPLGTDAKQGPKLAAAAKPVVTVIVVGETARAQNWGLNGYERDTTPKLRARNVVNYTDVASCGTATAVSMPCMFSILPREEYSHPKGAATENLLDVLTHAGLKVDWWDNNTGDQGIAKRIGGSVRMSAEDDASACERGECTDQVFLKRLDSYLAQAKGNSVLVLHVIGSHGPTYYLRYPAEFEQFKPACQTAEFAKCTPDEIRNSYDNTLLYTDHILDEIIQRLDASQNVTPALYYMSDHGESLGEDGLFLHGAPYFMAPITQRRVPAVLWLSQRFEQAMGLDQACLREKASVSSSHDNMFHSILGLMDIETETRDTALDLIGNCRVAG